MVSLFDRLFAQLANPGIADIQYQADFLEAQFMLVVERQHQPLTLVELGQCLGQQTFAEDLFLDAAA